MPPGKIQFKVNGGICRVDESVPRNTTLNAYLRYWLALPGTKAMCREGGCGACIVMVRARRYPSGNMETFSVNSCLVLVLCCNDWEITTIEGVGNRLTGYSDVQRRIAALNGTQCGYCTPGWVMQLTSLKDKGLSMAELEKSFGSNICRCTGYRPILDTIKTFAKDCTPELTKQVRDIEDLQICKKTGEECKEKKCHSSEDSDNLLEDYVQVDNTIVLNFENSTFVKVYDENDIFDVLEKYGADNYILVDGNTGKGILEYLNNSKLTVDISVVRSLKCSKLDQNLILGANISLQDCIDIFKDTYVEHCEFSYLSEFVKHFELIAHVPVRKIGSLAGNLMLKRAMPSYPSDVFLLLECVGAMITIRDSNGRRITMNMMTFLKYDMKEKLIVAILLPPLNQANTRFRSFKIMPRNQNALAIVNAAILLKLNPNNSIAHASIVYGNISPTFVHAVNTEQFLINKNVFQNSVLQGAIKMLSKEVLPVDNPPKIAPEIRKRLALGLFYKYVLNIAPAKIVKPYYRSGGSDFNRPVSKGTQSFQSDPALYPLNQPVQKLEALIQASGEAQYSNDLPPTKMDVFAAFVLSTVASGEVDCIDEEAALAIDGVLALYTAADIPGVNSFTFPGIPLETEDEEILATTIRFHGQPVAVVVATSEDLAHDAAKKVKIKYKNVKNTRPVITIDEAKKDPKRYIPGDSNIEPKGRGTNVTKVIKGVYEVGPQYHYYMEPLTTVVVPVDGVLEVYDATQWMDLTQIAVARAMGIKESDVVVKVRRVGGGFGGKISRNGQVAAACALVAKKMDRPCRFILPMKTNMAIAGMRLPCQCKYEVGVDDDGKIQYVNATIVEDAGCSNNENILAFVAGAFPNCYNPEYFKLDTAAVITDLASNSFMRAPGTAEGIASIEHIIEHIAFAVNKDPTAVRKINMRTDDNDLPQLIDTLKDLADYDKRVQQIEAFNKCNRWKKKSIKINVMSFPVQFYGNYSSLVTIYRGDGTVTVTTGGIEMGQGANTKVAQVCAYELGIPLECVSVLPNYSFTAANVIFSGSSITSECVCYATIKACQILIGRLEPIKRDMRNASWAEVIKKAGDEQVDLTASYMMTDKDPDLSNYSAFAVAILETVVDVLTGKFQMERADILEDAGLSANPNIDIGQIEGAYIQGIGYYTCEKAAYDAGSGELLTNGSLKYHVPQALDIPLDLRVHLRRNSKNHKGVLGSKTCGEMGICIAHGITHALRQCVLESRQHSGYDTTQWINISIPCDTESILRALDVKLEEFLIN